MNASLDANVKMNTTKNTRLTFDHTASDKIQELIDTNFKLCKQINDSEQFERYSR